MLPTALLKSFDLDEAHNDEAHERRFNFMLARDLGFRSVREMTDQLSYPEWREWFAFYTVEAQERERGSNR